MLVEIINWIFPSSSIMANIYINTMVFIFLITASYCFLLNYPMDFGFFCPFWLKEWIIERYKS